MLKAIHVGAGVRLIDVDEPGAFQFQDGRGKPVEDPGSLPDGSKLKLAFFLPNMAYVSIPIIKNRPPADHSWSWDGNVLLPSLTPSILTKRGGGLEDWHGYLTTGEFVPC